MVAPSTVAPALDTALLIVALTVLMGIQRIFGRAYLRRHGLRLRGVRIEPTRRISPQVGSNQMAIAVRVPTAYTFRALRTND